MFHQPGKCKGLRNSLASECCPACGSGKPDAGQRELPARPAAEAPGEWTDAHRDRENALRDVLNTIWGKRSDGNGWGKVIECVRFGVRIKRGSGAKSWRGDRRRGRISDGEWAKRMEEVRKSERKWLRELWEKEPDNAALRDAARVEVALTRRYAEIDAERDALCRARALEKELQSAREFVDRLLAFIQFNDRWPVQANRANKTGHEEEEILLGRKLDYYLKRHANDVLPKEVSACLQAVDGWTWRMPQEQYIPAERVVGTAEHLTVRYRRALRRLEVRGPDGRHPSTQEALSAAAVELGVAGGDAWAADQVLATAVLRTFGDEGKALPAFPCRLCPSDCFSRRKFHEHVDEAHCGFVEYRKRVCFEAERRGPYGPRVDEWRHCTQRFTEELIHDGLE